MASTDAQPPNSDYLDRLMRRSSFEALWPLFAKATKPAKEMTESYSALCHLRPLLTKGRPWRVIHVGDGAHARTGALFWNASAERIKGYRAEEIIGKHFSVFYTQEAADRDHPAEELRIATRNGCGPDPG